MPAPFISICIPAYQRVAYLHRLLQSIQQQTYTDYEIILTDDSPDESVAEILQSYAHLPITYFRNVPALGTPGNWNSGLQKANGSWIKIMHDDDWFTNSNSLEMFATAAKKTDCSFIFSACNYVHDSGSTNTSTLTTEKNNLLSSNALNLVYDNVIGHPSTVMHKKDDRIQYDKKYKWLVDIDFYMRYLHAHPGFEYINEPLVNIGVSDSQVSAGCYKNPQIEIPEYLSLLAAIDKDYSLQNKYVFNCLWNLVKKFKIYNEQQLNNYYSGPLPKAVPFIISYQKKIPRVILKQTPCSKYLMQKAFLKFSGKEV